MERPVIVIAAYDRVKPLKRLLSSLNRAKYPENVKLVISIDKGGSPDVISIANNLEWQYGEKKVICQKKHLGLRKHIMKCGDLSQKYGSIVLLEDDLFVSSMFYEYATKALNFYLGEERIAGISLYSPSINMHTGSPFIPISENTDVFFLQIPASWGEVWNHNQWLEFKNWFEKVNPGEEVKERLPQAVLRWPDSSWAKYFWLYMVQTNKYFVYPRISLTTQFSEIGVHTTKKSSAYQVPLQRLKDDYRFGIFKDMIATYDSFYEMLPDRLNRASDQFSEYDPYTIDLNGTKDLDQINTQFVLTSKRCKNCLFSFGRDLIPLEMNIIEGIKGSDLFFCDKKSINEGRYAKFVRQHKNLVFYRDLTIKRLLILLALKIFKRI